MGRLMSRLRMVPVWLRELRRGNALACEGDPSRGTVFLLDGVGGMLLAPMCVRRGLRDVDLPFAMQIYDWHSGLRGELLYDLVAYRHNRRKARRLAELLVERRNQFPDGPLHVIAHSGGTGIAAFALESLPDDVTVDTVILGCSALSPRFRLTAMLRHVQRCVALVSPRDWLMIGAGTSVFGTMDRRFGPSAGVRGFFRPTTFNEEDEREYRKLQQLFWDPSMKAMDHFGHHVGWATVPFVRAYLEPILMGCCDTAMHIGPLGGE